MRAAARFKILHRLGAVAFALWAGAVVAASAATSVPAEIRIGVLSVLDDDDAQRQWRPLAEGLVAALDGRQVALRALDPEALEAAVARGEVDFVVTNPGHYVQLEARHGVTRIATQASGADSDPGFAVGSAVVVRSDASARTLADLRGWRVAAVAPQAFGGYQLVAAQWLQSGIDADGGDVKPVFTGFPMQRVAQAVLERRADAGVLRTCVLEQLEREGRIPAGALRVVGARDDAPRGCLASTPLYPGWAFAALARTPRDLSRDVLMVLLAQPADALGSRWTVPADYQRVHDVLRQLQVGPYSFLRDARPQALLRRYWFVPAGALALLLLTVAYLLRVEVIVKRRTAALTQSLRERDRMASELAAGRQAMDHLSRLSILGELSATLAHELNHPLATISNYAASLRRRAARGDLGAEDLLQSLDAVTSESERAARVIDGVRALARKRVPERRRLRPATLAADTTALFRGMVANAPPVRLQIQPAADAAQVFGDAQQLQQVLLNLLQNALDAQRAAGRDTAPIGLGLQLTNDGICLSVHDDGAPLTEAQRSRLFEPFYTTKPDGLGLGLAICRGIAEAHGGALRARPATDEERATPWRGMVFELSLPTAMDEPVTAPADAAADTASTPQT